MFRHIRKPLRLPPPDITHAHRAALEKTSIVHDVSDQFHPDKMKRDRPDTARKVSFRFYLPR